MEDLLDTRSPQFVSWMAAVWKANDMRNKKSPCFEAQLAVCKGLREQLDRKDTNV